MSGWMLFAVMVVFANVLRHLASAYAEWYGPRGVAVDHLWHAAADSSLLIFFFVVMSGV